MLPTDQDMTEFLEDVSSVSRLINGLKAGTISPEYVDTKIAERAQSTKAGTSKQPAAGQDQRQQQQQAADAADTAKQAELLRKVEELKASRERKLKARQQYEGYVQGKKQQQHSYATDYTRWELWCPSDEEDDLFNSLTPNSPAFRAMEQDISKRHARMVEQRQIVERQRQLGNDAFKSGQYSEALRCYELGLEAQRHNMALHANAAMAALKLKRFVAAQEHCDKVLHLAEVLHNTPQHPLCSKALQRRAAAYQGLGQHSKAVADLQAAADILPGDAEVLEQLRRARVLLEEHMVAKQLTRLVCSETKEQQQQPSPEDTAPANSSTAATEDDNSSLAGSTSAPAAAKVKAGSGHSSSADASAVVQLQRIKQLVDELNSAASSRPTAVADGSSTSTSTSGQKLQALDDSPHPAGPACKELEDLLREPRHCIFFRECGGLEAVSKLVTKPPVVGSRLSASLLTQAALEVLNAACDSDTAFEQVPDQAVGATLDIIARGAAELAPAEPRRKSDGELVLLAALRLAYSVSMCSAARSRLGAQLVKPVQGSSRILGLWGVCCSKMEADSAASSTTSAREIRATAMSLLSNCMLVPALRSAMLPLLQQEGRQCLTDLAQQLACCPPGLAEKGFGLLSNMCNSAGLRGQLAACQQLMQQVLLPAGDACAESELQLAVLGCMCNLSIEQGVQQLMVEQEALTVRLLKLAAAGPALLRHGSSSRGAAGPKLPPRGSKAQSTPSSAAEAAAVSVRAVTLVSRIARQAGGVQQLQQGDALHVLAAGVAECLRVQQQQRQAASSQAHTAAKEWLAPAVRTLALLTAAPEACGSCSATTATSLVDACCQLLRDPAGDDAVKGNAAMVLKGFAADGQQRWHAALAKADAVAALVSAARTGGKGAASSRNAGIALAVLARAGGVFLDRLRDLRGLEVLHAYVQP